MRALLGFSALIAFLTACGDRSTEDELRGRLEGFFEAVLTGDAASLEGYVSDSCLQKAEFLAAVGDAALYEAVQVVVPQGAFSFDLEDGVAVAKRSPSSEQVLVNGESLADDPSNDLPLKFVLESGVWRLENCASYVPSGTRRLKNADG